MSMPDGDGGSFSLASIPAIDPRLRKKREKILANATRKARASHVVRVLSLGAGVQSTALILMDALVHRMGRRGDVEAWLGQDYPSPPLDFAIFADTGDEPEAVYRHLARLKEADGMAPILEGTAGRLGDDVIAGVSKWGLPFVSIPAFTSEAEGVEGGLTRRQCTYHYKVQVVEQVIRREIFGLAPGRTIPSHAKVVQVLGLSCDEPRRIATAKARMDASGWAEPSFPLADLLMERSDCIGFLRSFGWDAPRSACVFCPFRRNVEWQELRDGDPEGWARAIQVDRAMRAPETACDHNRTRKLYLHKSCLPLEEAPIDEPEIALGFRQECQGYCGN